MKYVVNIIAICALFIAIIIAVILKNNSSGLPFHNEVDKFFREVSQMMKARAYNIKMDISPSRKKNLTFIDKEENLKQFIPWVFGEFTASDWKSFWAVIYDPVYDAKSKYGRKRYRTKEEIKNILCERYPVFDSFDAGHWHYFWSVVDVKFDS